MASVSFAQQAGPGVSVSGASTAGPAPGLSFSPDGKYDLGGPSKERPSGIYVKNKVDIGGSPIAHVSVSLTKDQILGMYAAPVPLVSAQGAGKSIVVTKVQLKVVKSGTAFASGGVPIIQYAATVNGGGTQALNAVLTTAMFTGTSTTNISTRIGADITDTAATTFQNVGIYLSNATGAFTNGTGTAVVDIWYVVM